MQNVQRVSHNDMPMDMYQQSNELSSYSLVAHQGAMCNDPLPQQGRGYYVKPDAVASSRHRVTADHFDEALIATTNRSALLGDLPARSSSESSNVQPKSMIQFPERSFNDTIVLSKHGNGLEAGENSTLKPAMTSQDLASTLASDIADRLGLSSSKESQFKTKEDVERAIQNSVINLLGSNTSSEKVTRGSPARDAADTAKLFKCEFCSKKKKTQCDLT